MALLVPLGYSEYSFPWGVVSRTRYRSLTRRMTRRQWIDNSARLLGLGAIAGVAGCGGKRRGATEPNSITVLYPEDTAVLGPDDDVAAQFLMFLPLVAWNARGELEGRLAESWSHSFDYRTWTIRLRDGVRWHDGVPVTAHDIKFTVELLTHPDVLWWPADSFDVKVIDDLSYTIACRQNGLTGTIWDDWRVYYPKHILEKLDPKEFLTWDFWKHPVGNGPYRYVRHLPKTMLQLETNPDFYRGKPKIANLVLKLAEWDSGSVTELLTGNVDVATLVRRADAMKLARDPGFRVYNQPRDRVIAALLWNHRNPLFSEARIRKALTLAINRHELIQALNYPAETPVLDAPVSPGQLHRGEFANPLPHDPELANRLLDEAGWAVRNRKGIREREGQPFAFTAITVAGGNMSGGDAAVYVAAQLKRIGIEMNIAILDGGIVAPRALAGDYDAALWAMATGWGDLGTPRRYLDAAGYRNPRFLQLDDRIRTALDPGQEDALCSQVTRLFQEDVPATFLYPSVATTITSRRVRGLDDCPYRGEAIQCMDSLSLEE